MLRDERKHVNIVATLTTHPAALYEQKDTRLRKQTDTHIHTQQTHAYKNTHNHTHRHHRQTRHTRHANIHTYENKQTNTTTKDTRHTGNAQTHADTSRHTHTHSTRSVVLPSTNHTCAISGISAFYLLYSAGRQHGVHLPEPQPTPFPPAPGINASRRKGDEGVLPPAPCPHHSVPLVR